MDLWKELSSLQEDADDVKQQATSAQQQNEKKVGDDDNMKEKAAVIASQKDTFQSVISSLEVLSKMDFPDTESFAQLASILRSRLPEVEDKVEEIAEVADELSIRSAQVARAWLDDILLNDNRMWTEFEDRIIKCEEALRKIEAAKAKKDEEPYKN